MESTERCQCQLKNNKRCIGLESSDKKTNKYFEQLRLKSDFNSYVGTTTTTPIQEAVGKEKLE